MTVASLIDSRACEELSRGGFAGCGTAGLKNRQLRGKTADSRGDGRCRNHDGAWHG